MKVTAETLVRAAAEDCDGTTPDTNTAERIVAGVMAESGRSVTVNFEPN